RDLLPADRAGRRTPRRGPRAVDGGHGRLGLQLPARLHPSMVRAGRRECAALAGRTRPARARRRASRFPLRLTLRCALLADSITSTYRPTVARSPHDSFDLDHLRRRVARGLMRLLFGKAAEPSGEPLPRRGIHRILVCHISHTLGNALLLTPLIRELEATYPGAQIDIVTRSQ